MWKNVAIILLFPLGFTLGYIVRPILQSPPTEPIIQRLTKNVVVPPETELPDDLRRQFLADSVTEQPQVSRCKDIELKSYGVDLNKDGNTEYIIMPIAFCDLMVRGASGNGSYYIYQFTSEWERIGELNGNAVSILDTKTNDYSDMLTNMHSSVSSGSLTTYSWSGEEYRPKTQEWYDQQETPSQ